MNLIDYSNQHLSPLSLTPRVPAEPNSPNGANSRACNSPRQNRLNASTVLRYQGHPRAENVVCSSVSAGGTHQNMTGVREQQRKMPSYSEVQQRAYMEIGLENLGNTCFMNSSLQCLLHIQPLVSYFLATDIDKAVNDSSPMKGLLATSFAQLVREIFDASAGSSIAPLAFQKAVSCHAPHLLDNQQQDCQEFLRFLLDGMSEDLCRKRIIRSDGKGQISDVVRTPKKRLVISSRTRDRIKAGRVQANKLSIRNLSVDSERGLHSDNSVYGSSSLQQLDSSISRISNEMSSLEPSPVNDRVLRDTVCERLQYDSNDESITPSSSSKGSLALKLREAVFTASGNQSGSDKKNNFKLLLQKLEGSEKSSTTKESDSTPSIRVIKELNMSNHGSIEMFPEWFKAKEGSSNGVFNDDVSERTGFSLSTPTSESEISGGESRTPNSMNSTGNNTGRMRFKLPNILGPLGTFSLARGDRASAGAGVGPTCHTPVQTPSHTPVRTPISTPLQSVVNLSTSEGLKHEESVTSRRLASASMKIDTLKKNSDGATNLSNLVLLKPTCANSNNDSQDRREREREREKESDKAKDGPTGPSPEELEKSRKLASDESLKAWSSYLDLNSSVVTDIFAGQLQSTIECLTCRNRSFCFDPFLDLSVPIPRKLENRSKWRRPSTAKEVSACPLEECIEKFTGVEILDGENMYTCSKCCNKRKCTKTLSIYKYPRVLVIHIKRFRYSEVSREKLSTDVTFPLKGLDLTPYLSSDRPNVTAPLLEKEKDTHTPRAHTPISTETDTETHSDCRVDKLSRSRCECHEVSELDCSRTPATEDSISASTSGSNSGSNSGSGSSSNINEHHIESPSDSNQFDANLYLPLYDLVGVSNHCGTLNGGHYIAHVDTNAGAETYRKHHMGLNHQKKQQLQQQKKKEREKEREHERKREQLNEDEDDRCNEDQPECNDDDDCSEQDQCPEYNVESHTSTEDAGSRWMCFNDEQVSSACTSNIIGPSAYVLFYRLRES